MSFFREGEAAGDAGSDEDKEDEEAKVSSDELRS